MRLLAEARPEDQFGSAIDGLWIPAAARVVPMAPTALTAPTEFL